MAPVGGSRKWHPSRRVPQFGSAQPGHCWDQEDARWPGAASHHVLQHLAWDRPPPLQPVPKVPRPLADVTDPNSIKAAVRKVREEVGSAGLNLLINNVGTTRRSTLATETAENMTLVYTTNTIGPLQTSQAFLPLLKEAAEAKGQQGMSCSRAAIINISSILGSIEAAKAWEERQDVCFRCSKAALNMLTKCLALEYGSSGILCVSVDPGCVTPPLGQGTGPVTEEESVQGVLRLLARLSATSNGTFWDWRGQSLPW
ncbi:C-factor-like isoform X1 [Aquila chrysaetos chrysaetos]|uniref:C-factor-like isoform X1 n=1 Tax=Aquila chrysaetos chrysaetos TaxID=223781 RepID=UPI00117721CA|nr:C-factor-like isoform X1 [Aquila chrysaetos chrysaetos]